MTKITQRLAIGVAVATTLVAIVVAEAADSPIKDFMQKYHKAPKGTDPACKKVQDGTASKDEIKGLLEGYKMLAASKAPHGDEASWKEKTSKLLAAMQALEKGAPGAAAQYKSAVNCKACHSVHKGE